MENETKGSVEELPAREIWELVAVEDLCLAGHGRTVERGFASITWSPATFVLTLWLVDEKPSEAPLPYSTGLPSRILQRWNDHGLPPLSAECLDWLSALEVVRSG